jgi:hypothetical protein
MDWGSMRRGAGCCALPGRCIVLSHDRISASASALVLFWVSLLRARLDPRGMSVLSLTSICHMASLLKPPPMHPIPPSFPAPPAAHIEEGPTLSFTSNYVPQRPLLCSSFLLIYCKRQTNLLFQLSDNKSTLLVSLGLSFY